MNTQDRLFKFLEKGKYTIEEQFDSEGYVVSWYVTKTDEEGIDWEIFIRRI